MMITSPVLLGLLWLVSHFHQGLCQNKDQETHQVYSYTYHFQHNGTTDPKQIVRSLLSDPPEGRGAVVKTFWNPSVRGFVSQGFFPARPQTNGFQPKIPTFQGIKNVVEENLKRVPNPTPPELIKIPPNVENNIRNIDEEVNRRLNHVSNRLDHLHPGPVQGPRGVSRDDLPNLNLNQIPLQPVVNNARGLVTDVKTFEKDLPNGKIFEKIETFSYNPAPIINNAGGNQQNQVLNQNQRGFGRTVSYFRKEHRTGGSPFNQINQDPPVNEERNLLTPIRNGIENFNQHGVNQNSNFNHVNEVNNIIKNVNNKINRGFGQRLNNFQNANIQRPQGNFNHGHNNGHIENRHFHNGINQNNPNSREHNVNPNHNIHEPGRPNHEFHNQVTQNNNNNGFRNHHNQNFHNQVNQNNGRRIFNNPESQNFNNNHRFNNGIQNNIPRSNGNQFASGHIDNPADKVLNTLNEFAGNTFNNAGGHPNHDQEHRTGGNSFTWDDDNNGWKVMDVHNDWSNRNRLVPNNNNNNNNNRPHLNDIHHEQHNNNHNNPINVLKSTLESLVGRPLPFPTVNDNNGGQNGNFNNFRGTGEIRAFGVDSVSQNPNSYQKNLQRRYEQNFEVNSNSGYQFSRRWSAGDLSKLGSRSNKGPTFKKDYIDVFADDS